MPLSFGPNFVEGKVYRSRKKNEEDDEKHALKELQAILSSKHRKVCECEAQLHGLLENCLNCGRLTCESEGAGKCFNCGSLVVDTERRIRFQKYVDISPASLANSSLAGPEQSGTTNSRRAKLVDDQFDYFSIDNRKHLREEDRRKLKEEFDELQAQRFKRKLVLDVDLDNLEAGARSELVIEDYQKALRDLGSKDPSCRLGDERYNLHELVSKESKKPYCFQYVPLAEPKKKTTDSGGKTKGFKGTRIGNRAGNSKQKPALVTR